jgi:hypothetical protein
MCNGVPEVDIAGSVAACVNQRTCLLWAPVFRIYFLLPASLAVVPIYHFMMAVIIIFLAHISHKILFLVILLYSPLEDTGKYMYHIQ